MGAQNAQGALNHWAQGFLERHGATREETGNCYSDIFVKEYPLGRYVLPDGRPYYEAVQETAWSMRVGGVAFLALKNEKGNWVPKSLWSWERDGEIPQ